MRWWPVLAAACAPKGLDSGPSAPPSYPTDASAEGIAAFLDASLYREPPWIAETDAPREQDSASSPHDRVRVWGNEVLVASQAAGNGALGGSAHAAGSMSVKEIVEDDDSLLGLAVMLKIEGDADAWSYYCDGPETRCGVREPADPYYAVGWEAECAYCHGGLIFNQF